MTDRGHLNIQQDQLALHVLGPSTERHLGQAPRKAIVAVVCLRREMGDRAESRAMTIDRSGSSQDPESGVFGLRCGVNCLAGLSKMSTSLDLALFGCADRQTWKLEVATWRFVIGGVCRSLGFFSWE